MKLSQSRDSGTHWSLVPNQNVGLVNAVKGCKEVLIAELGSGSRLRQ